MTTYTCVRKPPEYRAIKYTGDNLKEVLDFIDCSNAKNYNPTTKSFILGDRLLPIKVGDIVFEMDPMYGSFPVFSQEELDKQFNYVTND